MYNILYMALASTAVLYSSNALWGGGGDRRTCDIIECSNFTLTTRDQTTPVRMLLPPKPAQSLWHIEICVRTSS